MLCALLFSVIAWGQSLTLLDPESPNSESNPYLIESSTDWSIFAYWISNGTNVDAYYKLTANIQSGAGLTNDVTTNGAMVGTKKHPFSGSFDGDGHDLVFFYKYQGNEGDTIAPFKYTNKAKIENLNVSGGLLKCENFGAAGLIGCNLGSDNTIVNNVTVGVSIYSNGNYSGGFVVYGSHITFTNCSYIGSFGSFTSWYAGGFCGFGDKTTQLNGCLFNPSSSTFWGENFVYTIDPEFNVENNIKNCFYTQTGWLDYDMTVPSTQGRYVYTIIPSNKIARKLTVINGVNVYDNSLISVDITFTNTDTQDEYTQAPYAEPITVGFTVKFDDVAVAPGDGEYTYTITDSYGGSTVQDIGEYTFKVEGNETNNYYGSATRHFYVTAPDEYGNWDYLKTALSSSGEGNITLDRNYKSGVGGSGALTIDRNVEIDLNGFTIDRNLDEADNYGQVIRVNGGKNVTIIGPGIIKGGYNKAINGTEHGASNDGGGIFNMGNLTLDKVTIANNKCKKQNDEANNTNAVGRGGGIYSGKGSTLTMTNVIIRDNEAKGGGGGIFADEATSFTMSENCSVRSNESCDKGGGIRVKKCQTATITNCIINSNIVDNHTTESVANGGGIHLDEGTLTLNGCTINNNRAYKYGGGMYVIKGIINVNNCTLNYNMAYDEDMHNEGRGGGIYMHGGVLNMNGGSIQGNSSNKSYGGGIYINSVATFNLSGSSTILSNVNYLSTESSYSTNVYLVGASTIHITGNIEGSSIGVGTNIGESVFTTGLSDNGTIALFTSDAGEYDVALYNNEAKLVIIHPWTPDEPDEGGYVWINEAVALSSVQTVTGNGVKFGANGSLTILPGGYLNANIINDDPAKLIIHGGQLVTTSEDVKATMKKDISAALALNGRFWYLISSGITTPTIKTNTNLVKLSANDYPEYDLYRFNEAVTNNLQWENYRQVDPEEHENFCVNQSGSYLENGRGYLYRNGNDYTITISGTLNSAAEIETNLTCTQPAEGTNVLKGFNIIGNPYPHNIKKGDVQAIPNGELLENNYYVLLENSTWELVDDGEEIHVMEGILVQAKKAGTLTISKTPVPAPASKGEGDIKASYDKIWFTINNNEFKDKTCVEFKPGHGLNKISHLNEEAPMLYVNYNGEKFASADVNPAAKVVNLNFEAKTTGMFTLSCKAKGNFSYLHLYDRLTGNDVDMLLDGEYTFIASPTDNENRFLVVLDPLEALESLDGTFAFQNGNDIIVNGNGELQIFDVMGRLIATQRINGVETVNVSMTGVYIFKLNEKTQKVVVR